MMQVTFNELVRVLETASSTVDAAEGHGCLCGSLCASADYTLDSWVEELIPEEDRELDDRDAQVLQIVFEETVRSLRGDAMEFEPLLPDEDAPLERRATNLAQWSQGFLYGFGTGGTLPNAIPQAVNEVLRDVAQIAGAAVDVGDSGEEEEEAYTEVFEYLRVGVQLIHDELIAVREDRDEPAGDDDDDLPLDNLPDEPVH